jgi:twitching motility protein PilT
VSQLSQLLAQLDRDGASELVISTNRPVALRVNGTYHTLTAASVTPEQLHWLIRNTQLVAMVADSEGVGELEDVDIEGRTVRAQVIRNGADIMVRVEAPKRQTKPPEPAARPKARAQTEPPVARTTRPISEPPNEPLTGPRVTRPSSEPPIRFSQAKPAVGQPAVQRRPTPPSRPAIALPDAEPDLPIRPLHAESSRPAIELPAEPNFPRRTTPPSSPPLGLGSGTRSRPAPADIVPQQPHEVPRPRRLTEHPSPIPQLIDEPCEITSQLAMLVRSARKNAASDLHIAANRSVMIRTVGELVPLEPMPRDAVEVEEMLMPLLGPMRRRELEERGYVDLAVEVPGAGRLRGNVSRQQGGLKGAFRLAVAKPPTLEELGLPPELAKLTEHHQGLIVIAGPSGHGKTTTLAALVDLVNSSEPLHILTIEDPVEIEHPRKAAVITQREVGRHTMSFAAALKASLREDPDVIVIGELRDRETVEIAMTAAETGHLVLATMSTPSAAKTIDRLIDMFPPDEQSQIRASLAGALRAIVAQRLLPSVTGDSVVPAVELVTGVLPLATLIRDNKLFQLPNLMRSGRAYGMLRLDDSLLEHVRAGRITEEVALRAAESRKELLAVLHPEAPSAKQTGKVGLFGKKDKP